MRIKTKKTKYTLYWGAMGLCFPALATILLSYERSISPLKIQTESNFLLWFMDLIPILLATFGRSLGRKQDKIEELTNNQRLELDAAAIIFHTNHLGIITYVNRTFSDEMGYDEDEIIGKNASTLRSDEHDTAFWQDFWGTIKKEQVWKGEVKNIRKDGSAIWLETTILPRYTREKISYHSIQIDISVKKAKAEKLLQSSKMHTIGELAYGVGHEINNPLAIAIGNMQLIKKLLNKPTIDMEMIKGAIEKHTDATNRIKNTVNGLRVFTRAASNAEVSLNVHELIKEAMDLVRRTYSQNGIQLLDQRHAPNFYVAGDPGKFQQIIMNLVRYAEASTAGQHSRIIRSTTHTEFDKIIIRIIDNGPYKSRTDFDFTSFKVTVGASNGGACGLGLIRSFVQEMNGTLEVAGTESQGNIFVLTLPIDTAATLGSLEKTFVKSLVGFKDIAKGLKVLVVDDEPEICRLMELELNEMGCEVDAVIKGQEALKLVQEKQYGMIFTDIRMPTIGGNEILSELKRLELRDRISIIAVTGGVPEKAYLEKYDGYLLKPYETKTLREIVVKEIAKYSKAS